VRPPGQVDRTVAGEDHLVALVGPGRQAGAQVVPAEETPLDVGSRGVHVGGVADGLGRRGPVRQVVEPAAGFEHGGHDVLQDVGPLGREPLVDHQRLLGVVQPQVLGGQVGEADALLDGDRVPGLAHAVPLHVAGLHVLDHVGRRDRDDLDLGPVDLGGMKPIAQPHVVCTAWKGHGERRLFALQGRLGSGQVAVADVGEVLLQGDRLAVVVQHHGDLEGGASRPADAGGHREGHAEQAVGAVDLAVHQVVPGGRPAGLFLDGHVEVALGEVAEFLGHHE
jgi:hypothetical protein